MSRSGWIILVSCAVTVSSDTTPFATLVFDKRKSQSTSCNLILLGYDYSINNINNTSYEASFYFLFKKRIFFCVHFVEWCTLSHTQSCKEFVHPFHSLELGWFYIPQPLHLLQIPHILHCVRKKTQPCCYTGSKHGCIFFRTRCI